MVPTNLVKYSTLLLVGLKLWGKSPVAHWPWVAVLLPYLIGAGGSMLVGLKLDEKAAGHIRRLILHEHGSSSLESPSACHRCSLSSYLIGDRGAATVIIVEIKALSIS